MFSGFGASSVVQAAGASVLCLHGRTKEPQTADLLLNSAMTVQPVGGYILKNTLSLPHPYANHGAGIFRPTFAWFSEQMLANIPYMEHMGHSSGLLLYKNECQWIVSSPNEYINVYTPFDCKKRFQLVPTGNYRGWWFAIICQMKPDCMVLYIYIYIYTYTYIHIYTYTHVYTTCFVSRWYLQAAIKWISVIRVVQGGGQS